MSFGPTNYRQGGTRGGADQFKWDDVKNDKYRENYLGHSVQAPVGRWQKGKDLTWYTKLNKEDRAAALKEEIALAKQRDQDIMDQALGIAPRRRAEPTGQLDAAEMKELLKRGASDREGHEAERIEGLGAAPVPQDFDMKPKKTLAEKYEETMARGGQQEDIYALRGSVASGSDAPRTEKEERAWKKAMKKQKKKAKKEKKKEKKRERKHRDDGSSEDDSDHGNRGRARRRDDGDERKRSRRSSVSSSRSPSRSQSRSPPRRRADHRSRSVSSTRDRRLHRAERRSSRSRSRSRGRNARPRRSRSRSPVDRGRRGRSPRRGRSRSDSRGCSSPRRR